MRTADVPGLDGVIYEGTWVVTLATKLLEYGAYRHGMTKRAAQDSCTARWTSHSHPPPPPKLPSHLRKRAPRKHLDRNTTMGL